jgi:hypothetical protein
MVKNNKRKVVTLEPTVQEDERVLALPDCQRLQLPMSEVANQ